jgi:hypothetical protein
VVLTGAGAVWGRPTRPRPVVCPNCLEFMCLKLISLDIDAKDFEIDEFVDQMCCSSSCTTVHHAIGLYHSSTCSMVNQILEPAAG